MRFLSGIVAVAAVTLSAASAADAAPIVITIHSAFAVSDFGDLPGAFGSMTGYATVVDSSAWGPGEAWTPGPVPGPQGGIGLNAEIVSSSKQFDGGGALLKTTYHYGSGVAILVLPLVKGAAKQFIGMETSMLSMDVVVDELTQTATLDATIGPGTFYDAFVLNGPFDALGTQSIRGGTMHSVMSLYEEPFSLNRNAVGTADWTFVAPEPSVFGLVAFGLGFVMRRRLASDYLFPHVASKSESTCSPSRSSKASRWRLE